MAVYSKYPIDLDAVRTFQNFKWKDMPGNRMPPGWYTTEEQAILPVSSKSHWDLPISIGKRTVHFLVSHPTPPVFDGAEDRNGRRNFDEIRLWADYITPGAGGYIYDDVGGARRPGAGRVVRDRRRPELRPARRGQHPGLDPAADRQPARQHPHTPESAGAAEAAALQGGANADTPLGPEVRHGRLQ